MQLESFYSLTPGSIGHPMELTDAFYDLEWQGGQYALEGPPGAKFYYAEKTGASLVHLECGLTLPEVKAMMAANPYARLLSQKDDTEDELANFTSILAALELPWKVKMPFADVLVSSKLMFPSLFHTKAEEITGNDSNGATQRRLVALNGPLLIDLQFRSDELWSLEITDLALLRENDQFDSVAKAWRTEKRQEAVEAARANPLAAAQEYLQFGFSADAVEWSRNFPLEAPSKSPSEQMKDEMFSHDQAAMLLPAGLGNIDMMDMEVEDIQTSMMRAAQAGLRTSLKKKYGSFTGLIEKAPAGDLFNECVQWLGRSLVSMHPQSPTLARMANCLGDLYDSVMHHEGLEGWLTCYLDSSWDTMNALLAVEASELIHFIADFTDRARTQGCDVMDESSWRTFFEEDSCMEDEKAIASQMESLPALFRAWALAHPEIIEREDNAVGLEFSQMVPKAADEMRDGLKSLLSIAGASAMKMSQAFMSNSDSVSALSPALDEMISGIAGNEQTRLRAKYGSLDELIGSCPIKRIFSNTSAYGGYVAGQPIGDLAEPVRMAACLSQLQAETEIMGLDYWFENHWDTLGQETIKTLRQLGSTAVADQIEQISRLPDELGKPLSEDYGWTDLSMDHGEGWPDSEEFEQALAPVREAFRQHWADRTSLTLS